MQESLLSLFKKTVRYADEQLLLLLDSAVGVLLYLHEHGSLHGNIKLSNIFQTKDEFREKCIFVFGDYYAFMPQQHRGVIK
jgi:serine/threonine protein kinase